MATLFEVVDPRGYTVICTSESWEGHILRARPWMEKYFDELKRAIEEPRMGIYRDADRDTRYCYYGFHQGKERYMKVVVEFRQNTPGYVITAYPANSGKVGEQLVWMG